MVGCRRYFHFVKLTHTPINTFPVQHAQGSALRSLKIIIGINQGDSCSKAQEVVCWRYCYKTMRSGLFKDIPLIKQDKKNSITDNYFKHLNI